MFKKLYSRFLEGHGSNLHFASHSHHFWPDVTREAQLQYWDDSAKWSDAKWNKLFSEKVPLAQKLIAENLNLSNPEQLVFAPNTHEFVFRLLSALDWQKKNFILTTDSEFYSFDRQINRLSELGSFEITKVETAEFASFEDRFIEKMLGQKWDFIFLSHVFFNSGYVCDLKKIMTALPADTTVVIDGYHGFMAIPTDLSYFEDRCFYLAGSYKYAQGGEGACFLHVPSSTRHRPLNTGWFAELSKLSSVGSEVGYPTNAFQYAGSTMDLSALYRLIAVLTLFKNENMTTPAIHGYVQSLQSEFIEKLNGSKHPWLRSENLVVRNLKTAGHFLSFKAPSTEECLKCVESLKKEGVLVDSRKNILRFGFGLYHDLSDVEAIIKKINIC